MSETAQTIGKSLKYVGNGLEMWETAGVCEK